MTANAKQIAGDHYKTEYQHWDMLVTLGFKAEYYVGQVTKYIMRWRKKNGLRDIRKGQHFTEKLLELVKQHGERFLSFGGVADGDLEVVVQQHLEQHLNHFFHVNEVGQRERAICCGVIFANDATALQEVLLEIELLAAGAQAELDKDDLERPVSRGFRFIAYTEDGEGMQWECKACGEKLNLRMDQPPNLAHVHG